MPRTATRRITSADVARHAGVSRATVSYVVNDVADAGISAETKERVLAAAAELGYSQYGPGRALKSGRSDVVLFVLNDMPVGHAINQLVHELQVRFGANGLSLVLYRVGPESNPLSRIWREIGPRAVIGFDSISSHDANEMRRAGIDVVRVSLGAADGPDVLTFAESSVGESQVRFLAGLGHRHIGYAYPDEPRVATFAIRRLEGARYACRDLGLPELEVRTVGIRRAEAGDTVQTVGRAREPDHRDLRLQRSPGVLGDRRPARQRGPRARGHRRDRRRQRSGRRPGLAHDHHDRDAVRDDRRAGRGTARLGTRAEHRPSRLSSRSPR